MSARTPGPWTARSSRLCLDFGIVSKDNNVIAEVFSDIEVEDRRDVEQARANARLMAASPELLESLQFAIRFFDQLTPADAERMRAVVAKATGDAA